MNPIKILVVEDDQSLLRVLSYNLQKEGYEVFIASDGAEAFNLFRLKKPDLVLLDVMLPVMSGLEVCRMIRKEANTPILMLTARTEETDKVTGLDTGADDYMTKPFGMRELMARIRALIRREINKEVPEATLDFGDISVDPARHTATKAGKLLELTPKEFDLLSYLAQNRGLVFSRDRLLEHVWGYDFAGSTRTVDVHIRWLREKIEPDANNPRYLITVRGTGYKLEG